MGGNKMRAGSLLSLVFVFWIGSVISLSAQQSNRNVRAPDDSILRPIEGTSVSTLNRTLENTSNPIDDALLQSANSVPKESDVLETEYSLNGARGKESPTGKKYGRYCQNPSERSGFPNCLIRFALPSITSHHKVGYVGGGTALGGERRSTQEGTFGFDYSGFLFSRKTWLMWSHGARYQGGAGRYETDGPKILPEK